MPATAPIATGNAPSQAWSDSFSELYHNRVARCLTVITVLFIIFAIIAAVVRKKTNKLNNALGDFLEKIIPYFPDRSTIL